MAIFDNDAAPLNVFPFMRLPWELQQRIYFFYFQEPKKRDVLGSEYLVSDRCRLALAAHGNFVFGRKLILASKLIYHEAMPIYYRTKIFDFECVKSLWKFLRVIGPVQRSYVAHICFILRGAHESYALRLLADCPRLQTLEIVFDGDHFSPHRVERLFQVRGLKSVKLTVPHRYSGHPHKFEAALQVLMLPFDSAVMPLGPARAFALHGTPRSNFGLDKSTKRARSTSRDGSEGTGSEKTETVLTKTGKGLEDDQRQTRAERIKRKAQV